jgi:hypothetical protein
MPGGCHVLGKQPAGQGPALPVHHDPVGANLGWHARKPPTKVGDYQGVRWHGPVLPIRHDLVGANLGWHAQTPPTKVGIYQGVSRAWPGGTGPP